MNSDPNAVLLLDVQGAVASLTLNRPKALNALNAELKQALIIAAGQLNDRDDIRVVIIKGAGKGFSAGADLASDTIDPVSFHLDQTYKPFLTAIERSDKIWIAQVHGPAAGIAAAIAMNCDYLVMAQDAYLYLAFAAIGLVPDGGNTKLLLDYLGYHHALEAVLEGKKLSAMQCLEAKIANTCVPLDQLETKVDNIAQDLASAAPLALAASKRLLRRVANLSYGEAITEEGIEQTPLLKSQDFREGAAAFFEKRKPNFKGT